MANNTSEKKAPHEPTIGELLSRLKVSHTWGIVVIIFGLVSGSFGLGYKLEEVISGAKVRNVAISEMKHEFFARYNRYITTRDNFEASSTTEAKESYELAKTMFVDLISGWWEDQQNFDGDLTLKPEVIRKGFDPTKSKVIFADGAEFVIPPEIKLEVLEREHSSPN